MFDFYPPLAREKEKQEEEGKWKRENPIAVSHYLYGVALSENGEDELRKMAKKKIDGRLRLAHEKRYQEQPYCGKGKRTGEEKQISFLYMEKREGMATYRCDGNLALSYQLGDDGRCSLLHRLRFLRNYCRSSK